MWHIEESKDAVYLVKKGRLYRVDLHTEQLAGKVIVVDNDCNVNIQSLSPETLIIINSDGKSLVDGDSQCFAKAKLNGEPTFTIRAQDICAVETIDKWQQLAKEAGSVKSAEDGITKFVEWQDVNRDKVKVPD